MFSTTSKKVILNTAFQLLGKVATTATTLLITMFVTRRFGPEGYGNLALMLAYSALFYIVVDFGINAIAVRRLAAAPQKMPVVFGNILSLRLLMALGLFTVGAAALVPLPYPFGVKLGILIGLLTIFTQALYTSCNAVFQARLRYDLSVLAAVAGSAAILVLSFGLVVLARQGILAIVGSYIVGGVVMVGLALFWAKRLAGGFRWRLDIGFVKGLVGQALPLGVATVFSAVLAKADTLILSILLGSQAVGLYGVAYKIFEVALVFPTFFVNAAYPVLVRHFGEGRGRLIKTARTAGAVLFTVSVAASALGIALSPLMVKIVGGGQFGASVLALRLLLLGLPTFYLSALFLWLMITLGQQRLIPFIYGLGAVLNIAANIIFIPRFGFYASAVITWVCEFLILILLVLGTIRSLNFEKAQSLSR